MANEAAFCYSLLLYVSSVRLYHLHVYMLLFHIYILHALGSALCTCIHMYVCVLFSDNLDSGFYRTIINSMYPLLRDSNGSLLLSHKDVICGCVFSGLICPIIMYISCRLLST